MRSIEMKGRSVEEARDKALLELGLPIEAVVVDVISEGDEGSFLGIGRKPALVRVTERSPESIASDELSANLEQEELDDAESEAQRAFVASAQDREDKQASQALSSEAVLTESETSDSESESSFDSVDESELAAFVRAYIQRILDAFESPAEINIREEEEALYVDIDGEDCGILIGRRGETLQAIQYISSLAMLRACSVRKRLYLDIASYFARRRNALVSLAKRTADRALKTGNAYELNPMKSSERRIVHEALQGVDGIMTYSEGDEPQRYVVIDLTPEEDFES
ncbi:MAG: RNA-binding cell elongation regulator Jag/EloR [Eubacteriales bacterium]|nr:RNA-binding cell elongation regulator Jag/EloR [Eubacteriales bacterium]